MTIGGIYNSFQSSYGMQRIQTLNDQNLQKINENNAPASEITENVVNPQPLELDNRPEVSRIANLEDVSLTFNKEDSFDYIGNDSSIDNLDMQKAVADMQKDMVLQEYQYFVGNPNSMIGMQTEDGVVVLK